ncbi:MAG: carboxypeptidase regulatory-like domain-containing protein, partial [Balneolaceae bacterium]
MADGTMISKFFLSYLVIGTLLLLFVSCDKIYEPITVRGKVVDVNTSQPVSNAIVSITSPQDLAAQTFSNENGEFLFEEVAVDSVIDITITAFKEGFTT